MTHYRFTQAVRIAGKNFGLGIQQVTKDVEEHPHFLRYAECGWVHEVSPQELVPAKAPEKRNTDLAAKLRAKKPEQVREQVQETKAEQVQEGVQEKEEDLTPQQRAARTRKANAEKAKTEAAETEGKGEEE